MSLYTSSPSSYCFNEGSSFIDQCYTEQSIYNKPTATVEKPVGYIVGEYVLRPLIDLSVNFFSSISSRTLPAVYDFCTSSFNLLTFPGASAETEFKVPFDTNKKKKFEPYVENFVHPGFHAIPNNGEEIDVSCKIRSSLLELTLCYAVKEMLLRHPNYKKAYNTKKSLDSVDNPDGYLINLGDGVEMYTGIDPKIHANYKDALRKIEVIFLNSSPEKCSGLDFEETIRNIHSVLMRNLKNPYGKPIAQGKYRTGEIVIYRDNFVGDARKIQGLIEKTYGKNGFETFISAMGKFNKHGSLQELTPEEQAIFKSICDTVAPAKDVPQLMNKFAMDYFEKVEQLSNKEEVLKFAAWVHMTIAHIHPFEDGNGRIARIFMNIAPRMHGYYSIIFLNDEKYIKAVRKDSEYPGAFYKYLLRVYRKMPLKAV